jgi:ferredoxin
MAGDENLNPLIETTLGAPMEKWASEDIPKVAAMIKDDTACTRCALCAQRCPTGAITMESFRFEELLAYDRETSDHKGEIPQ